MIERNDKRRLKERGCVGKNKRSSMRSSAFKVRDHHIGFDNNR